MITIRVVLIIGCIIFAGGGNLLLKAGMMNVGNVTETHLSVIQYVLKTISQPTILIGVVLYIASFVMWLSLLSMMEISAVYPIFVSAAFLLVMVGSVIWFNENVNALRIIGTLVVTLGIFIVSRSG